MAAIVETKGDRTRRRLLGIAVRRFAADGFRGTSVSAVAREAGLTPAAVYAYFDGKEALFEAAVDADADALITDVRARVPHGPVRHRWLALVALLIEVVDEHPLARRVLAGQEQKVMGRLIEVPALAALRAELARDMRDEQAAGTVRTDVDVDTLVDGLVTVVLALLMAAVQVPVERRQRQRLGILEVLDAAVRAPTSHG